MVSGLATSPADLSHETLSNRAPETPEPSSSGNGAYLAEAWTEETDWDVSGLTPCSVCCVVPCLSIQEERGATSHRVAFFLWFFWSFFWSDRPSDPTLSPPEAVSKSDEYTTPHGAKNLRTILLCLSCLGRVNYNDEKRPDGDELANSCKGGGFQSILGDREKIRGTYREIIVFDDNLIYPGYICRYKRVEKEKEES